MNKSNFLLSISMLISGREEMKKSLDSLMYFKNAFPTEIILVDTGCNAEQRELAEKYADKIVDFEWCNDFAAARNAGLREIHGVWFMYLDDDEWFENPQEIISFFLSGEYKRYNSASYVIRNYTNRQGTMYNESYPSRMVKVTKGIRFCGKVHEYLEPYKLPKKEFADFVHHYGYVYENEEARKAHGQRNLIPLLEMRKEHPGDPRWICQLAQEYFFNDEYEKTITTCEEGLAEWRNWKQPLEYTPAHIGALYGYILASLDMTKNYSKAEKWLDIAIRDPLMSLNEMKPTLAFFHSCAARLYSNIYENELSRMYFGKYINAYKELKDDRTAIELGTAAIVTNVFQESNLYGTILTCIHSLIRTQDYQMAEEAFFMMQWDDRRLLRQEEWEKKITDACCSVPYHPLWVKILQTLVAREDGMKEMYVVFLETEMEYKHQMETEKISKLRHLVAELDYEHRYITYTKILWEEERTDIKSEEQRKAEISALFDQMFDRYPKEIIYIRAEVFQVAERLEIDLEPFLLQINFRVWRQALNEWCAEAAPEQIQEWDARMAKWRKQEDIRYDILAIKCLEGYLRNHAQALLSYDTLKQLLQTYADKVLAFFKPYYKENVFEELPEVLPDEVQLALELKKLYQYQEKGEDRNALESVRKCLGICPDLDGAVAAYAEMYRDELKKRTKEAEEAQDELLKMAESLKSVAKLRMERGEYEAAKLILQQTQQYVPEDEEIKSILMELDE